MILVPLESYEFDLAVYVGGRRCQEAHAIGGAASYSQRSGKLDDQQVHIMGAGAEVAVAKWLNLFWPGTVNTWRKGVADVGRLVEVRWRSQPHYQLKVQLDDDPQRIYVLVRGSFLIVGWLWGKEAMQREWIKDFGAVGSPAYFPPNEKLRPPNELLIMRQRGQPL